MWMKLNVGLLAPEKPGSDWRPGWQLMANSWGTRGKWQLNHSWIPDPQKPQDDKYCFKQLCFGIICYTAIDNSYITQMSTNENIYIYILFIQWHITQQLKKIALLLHKIICMLPTGPVMNKRSQAKKNTYCKILSISCLNILHKANI